MLRLRDLWSIFRDYRALKATWTNRDTMPKSEMTQAWLNVVRKYVDRTETNIDDLIVRIGDAIVDRLDGWWHAWDNRQADAWVDETMAIMGIIAPLTDSPMDDSALALYRSTPGADMILTAFVDKYLFSRSQQVELDDAHPMLMSAAEPTMQDAFGDGMPTMTASEAREALVECCHDHDCNCRSEDAPRGVFGAAGEPPEAKSIGTVIAVIQIGQVLFNLWKARRERRNG